MLKRNFIKMDELVVTATRTNKLHRNVPIATELILKSEIERSGARTIAELLSQRSGVSLQTSVEGGSVLNLLGLDSRYILILKDGQPITGRFNNRVDLNHISLTGIEKIEISKGPGSAIYGTEAMGGVINIITGSAAAIGKELTENPIVKKISFTGSTEVGKVLLKQSASTVKKVSMELGGHAPFVVFEDANIDEAVTGAMQSKFRNSGQTCICANRIFVHEKVYDKFLDKFTQEVNKIKVGNGLEEGIVSGPLIDQPSLMKVLDQVKDAVNQGAKVAVGGDVHSLGGNFFQPTVLSNVTTKAKITYEETFGPIAPLYKFSSDEEVIKLANDTPYGLASYFYSRDIGRIWRVAEALEYGMVGVNTGLTTKAEIPFGGVKESGLGREGSRYGLDDYLNIKYISMAGI